MPKRTERYARLIDSLESDLFPFQESEFEAERFTPQGRWRVDEWLDRHLKAAFAEGFARGRSGVSFKEAWKHGKPQ